jgi:hypothetical protein
MFGNHRERAPGLTMLHVIWLLLTGIQHERVPSHHMRLLSFSSSSSLWRLLCTTSRSTVLLLLVLTHPSCSARPSFSSVTWPWHFRLRPPPADRSSGTTVVGRTTIPSPPPRPFMVESNNPKLNIDTAPLPVHPLVLPPSSPPPPQTRPLRHGHERERRVLVGQASTAGSHPCTTDGHI